MIATSISRLPNAVKDKEFDRRVDAVVAAPDADQEKHRHQRRLEEKVKDKQIERDKNADHRRFEQQQKDIKRRPLFSTACHVEITAIGMINVVKITSQRLRPSTPT